MNSSLINDTLIISSLAYVGDCFTDIKNSCQKIINGFSDDKLKDLDPNKRFNERLKVVLNTGLFHSIQLLQIDAILETALGTYKKIGVMKYYDTFESATFITTAALAIIALIGTPLLTSPRQENQEANWIQKFIHPISDRIDTIAYTTIVVASLATAYFNASVTALIVAGSLLYGMADRAQMINPTVSKVVNLVRLAGFAGLVLSAPPMAMLCSIPFITTIAYVKQKLDQEAKALES